MDNWTFVSASLASHQVNPVCFSKKGEVVRIFPFNMKMFHKTLSLKTDMSQKACFEEYSSPK